MLHHHRCGFFPGVNGLKGDEFNFLNTSDPASAKVTVQDNSPYVGPFDPDHGTPATTDKIFTQKCLNAGGGKCATPTMGGFIEYAYLNRHKSVADASSLMNMFTPERLPVMSALAQEFALFDRFFASHPGPTWPNRLFQVQLGTLSLSFYY